MHARTGSSTDGVVVASTGRAAWCRASAPGGRQGVGGGTSSARRAERDHGRSSRAAGGLDRCAPTGATPVAVLEATERARAEAEQAKDNRRSHRRVPRKALDWVEVARVKYGPEVSIVDISQGGVLVESDRPLKPGSKRRWKLPPAARPSSCRSECSAARSACSGPKGRCIGRPALSTGSSTCRN